MKEQFVPYEIANILKEKGFDEPCFGTYNSFGDFIQSNSEYPLPKNSDKLHDDIWLKHIQTHFPDHTPDMLCTAPLWQQVIDWLRDKHQIEIVLSGITVYDIRKYHICLYYNVDGIMTDHSMLLFDEETREYAGYQTFTYPEARQAAIEHALTLI